MENITFKILSNQRLFTLGNDLLQEVIEVDMVTLGLASVVNKLAKDLGHLMKALKQEQTCPFSETQIQIVRNRDERFMALKYYLRTCQYSADENISAAAQRLALTIHTYGGNLYQFNEEDENAAFQNLLNDFNQGVLRTDIITIKATEYVMDLYEAQENLTALLKAINTETRINMSSLAPCRRPLETSLRNLLHLIDLLYISTGSAELENLIGKADRIINVAISSAQNSKAGKDKL